MKRFYKNVAVNDDGNQQFQILLDDRPVKTPSGKMLSTPSKDIADAMSKEWSEQGENIDPQTMPITQIVTTYHDHAIPNRSEIEKQTLNYLNTDMIFYRAPNEPATEAMAKRQAEKWDRWVTWLEDKSGSKLETTTELAALSQDEKAHQYVLKYVRLLDDFNFTLLQILTSETGSLILALAYLEEDISPRELLELANVEDFLKGEIYNSDFYGHDPHLEKQWKEAERIFVACRICGEAVKS
jgi:chaperone required for assembly of F1-ATPase